MDPLRFGAADHPDTAGAPGVVAGVGGYGNCLGLPNIGGEVVLRTPATRQPAGQRAVRGRDEARGHPPGEASGTGNKVILYGARTGGDGIGGVSVLASETFDATGRRGGPRSRSATRSRRSCSSSARWNLPGQLVAGIQDLGGAGLSCATSELASAGSGGMAGRAGLGAAARRDALARRDPDERVAERMCAIVEPGKSERSWRSARSGDVIATVVR